MMTTTTKFILPMIYNNDVKYSQILEKSFVNSYICDYKVPIWDDKIIVVKSKEGCLKDTKDSCIATYETKNSFVYIYDVPEKHKQNYYFVVNGQYELLDQNYKNDLLSFWEEDFDSPLHYALYKPLYKHVQKKLKNKDMKIDYNMEFNPSREIYWRE